jgi:N-acetyl-anhydromuramyl-L-alanine amidase AmpD
VQATFRWDQQLHGAHAGNALINARGIGICLIGDFEKTAPSTRQLDALRKLVVQLAGRYQISRRQVIGHSSVRSTQCPGRLFPLRKIQEAVPQA